MLRHIGYEVLLLHMSIRELARRSNFITNPSYYRPPSIDSIFRYDYIAGKSISPTSSHSSSFRWYEPTSNLYLISLVPYFYVGYEVTPMRPSHAGKGGVTFTANYLSDRPMNLTPKSLSHDINRRKEGERRKRRLEENPYLQESDLETETVKYRDNRVVG